MESNPEQASNESVEASQQVIFDEKFNDTIDTLGASLEKHQIGHAFVVVFDEQDGFKPKIFYRGDMFNIVKHTSRALNQMKFKIMNELNGNF